MAGSGLEIAVSRFFGVYEFPKVGNRSPVTAGVCLWVYDSRLPFPCCPRPDVVPHHTVSCMFGLRLVFLHLNVDVVCLPQPDFSLCCRHSGIHPRQLPCAFWAHGVVLGASTGALDSMPARMCVYAARTMSYAASGFGL